MKKIKETLSFIVTLFLALICAGIIRSFWFEPFHIPSGSMKPNLLVGDYIIVSKYSYGYSRFSFPFGYNFEYFKGRVLNKEPQRGDVVVFRYPADTSINYVKRLIGMPGDTVQMIDGVLYINDKKIPKEFDSVFFDQQVDFGKSEINIFQETLPEGKKIKVLDAFDSSADDTGIFKVPANHYFMMGDNRDNSQDSRFLSAVGFVHEDNIIGKARFIFLSTSQPIWKFWKYHYSLRFSRIFKKIL